MLKTILLRNKQRKMNPKQSKDALSQAWAVAINLTLVANMPEKIRLRY